MPLILVGDTKLQKLEKYLTKNESCFQRIERLSIAKIKPTKNKGTVDATCHQQWAWRYRGRTNKFWASVILSIFSSWAGQTGEFPPQRQALTLSATFWRHPSIKRQ